MEGLAGSGPAHGKGLAAKIWRKNSGEIGWGGRIRTSTVLINSEVSYRLDHAPAARPADARPDKSRWLRYVHQAKRNF
jgi:hypothetical protein